MIVSHKNRFIFLKTRKTAGTSIEISLRPYCGPDDIITRITEDDGDGIVPGPQNYLFPRADWPQAMAARWDKGWRPGAKREDLKGIGYFGHVTASELRPRVGAAVFDSYFKFSIERNPWDREVSMYFFKFKNEAKKPTFAEYIAGAKDIGNWDIYSIAGEVVTQAIIRYDRLADDLAKVTSDIGLPPVQVLSQAKSGFRPAAARDYRAMYDSRSRDLVSRLYAREIEHFGWQF
ncbi:sulfotransferase family 2 domain-containing protein [Aestuariivirga sp.]|uniref:sulfotransferase family 2 domain-containing protein n=1 Tax=Aestuariivirga sp. TaxID=2650926 RepID=UPI00391DE4B0